jgi:hypothetical protein
MGQAAKPAAETEIALTLVGMHHSRALREIVQIFLDVLALMVELQLQTPSERRTPRDVSITDEEVAHLLTATRRLFARERWPRLFYSVLDREPFLGFSGNLSTDGHWKKHIPREVREYAGVQTVEEYVSRLERLTAFASHPVQPVAPSPLAVVAALDYLDAVWRVSQKGRLFTYPSAERTTKLAYDANTVEELDSRLSALGEILRSANASARAASGVKLAPAAFDYPLAPLEDHLVRVVDPTAEARVRLAVTDLERALALRDAAQHADAGDRAVRALDAFGLDHPVLDAKRTWNVITSRVVEALGAIREELAAVS